MKITTAVAASFLSVGLMNGGAIAREVIPEPCDEQVFVPEDDESRVNRGSYQLIPGLGIRDGEYAIRRNNRPGVFPNPTFYDAFLDVKRINIRGWAKTWLSPGPGRDGDREALQARQDFRFDLGTAFKAIKGKDRVLVIRRLPSGEMGPFCVFESEAAFFDFIGVNPVDWWGDPLE